VADQEAYGYTVLRVLVATCAERNIARYGHTGRLSRSAAHTLLDNAYLRADLTGCPQNR
jgi:hypothetical protein